MRPWPDVSAAPRSHLATTLRNGVLSVLFASGATHPRRAGRGRLTVATFHRVLPAEQLDEYPLPHLAVTVEQFAWFVSFLARHYTCGPLGSLHARWSDGETPARPFLAITFDDGQLDNFLHARPVLERAGLAGTFFVPVGAVESNELLWHDRLGYAALRLARRDPALATRVLGVQQLATGASGRALVHAAIQAAKKLPPKERLAEVDRIEAAAGGPARPAWDGIMGWDELRQMVRAGHEIGSHSASHPILPLLDDAALPAETEGSRRRIQAMLEISCDSFCYPNGSLDDRVAGAVRDAGYRRAVTTAPGPNAPGQDPLRLTRCELQGRHAGSASRTGYQLSTLPGRRLP